MKENRRQYVKKQVLQNLTSTTSVRKGNNGTEIRTKISPKEAIQTLAKSRNGSPDADDALGHVARGSLVEREVRAAEILGKGGQRPVVVQGLAVSPVAEVIGARELHVLNIGSRNAPVECWQITRLSTKATRKSD